MATEFPSLLVATEFPPNGAGGGAAVVRQMLKDWPAEKLYWWSYRPDSNELFGRKVAGHAVAVLPRRLAPNRRWALQKSWLLGKFWVPWAARYLRKTVRKFKPDVVWAIPHAWAIPPLARVLPASSVSFHVSIHDYVGVHGAAKGLGADRCGQMAKQVEELYSLAVTRDAISRQMLEDLEERTGAKGTINRAGLDQNDFDFLAREHCVPRQSIRIGYAGSIPATDEFALVVRTLGEIRAQLSCALTLELFGDHSQRSQSWFDPSWMSEHGNLPAAALAKALKECDWGFSPMRLTDDDPRYNHFSLPTKFVSYLAAGLPIIVVGHPESTVVKMATQYEVGICLTDGNPEVLKAKMLAALSEPNPKARYREELQRCALAEFDARQMRAVLYENLRRCASRSRS